MRISISQNVFPSYNQVRSKLIQKQNAEYKSKIAKLNHCLKQIQSTYDFKIQHDEIKQSILSLAQPPNEIPFFKDPLKMEPAQRVYISGKFNSESLNYYIGDDGEADNNYQTFLKFKKKALERDLQEEQLYKRKNKKQMKKQREEEEQFFKNLYTKFQKDFSQNKVIASTKSTFTKHIQNSQMKENDSKFISPLLKSNMQSTSKSLHKVTIGAVRAQQQQNENNLFENNRKYLTENYLQILKKLQNTNIVKWRVLNRHD